MTEQILQIHQPKMNHGYIVKEEKAESIALYENAKRNPSKFIYFKQVGTISTPSGKPLEFVELLTYLGINIYLQKGMSTQAYQRHGLLLTCYWSYGILIYPTK